MESITVNFNIEPSIIENIFVTAFEGGSNYWYNISIDDLKKIKEIYKDEEIRTPSSIAIFRAIMEKGCEISILDLETDEILGVLSKTSVINGLQKLINDESYQYSLFYEINGDGDATTSDVCMQFFVMGEVIFG